jgi:hypothetical protein
MSNEILANSLAKTSFRGRNRRRIMAVLTVITGCIGAGMVVGAWFSIGHVHGEAVIDLALLGIIIPLAVYSMGVVRGWQDTVAAGGELGRVAAWCTRTKTTQIIPFFCLFTILGLAQSLNHALDRPYTADTASDDASVAGFDAGMRRACVSSGMASLGDAANGPHSAQLHSRVEAYCGCVGTGLKASYSMAELAALAASADRMSHEPKVQRIIAACQQEAAR